MLPYVGNIIKSASSRKASYFYCFTFNLLKNFGGFIKDLFSSFSEKRI